MGTAIMELNIAQDLSSVYEDPILLVFLDLRKVYYNLDRGWTLKTLDVYGSGGGMREILEDFWAR